MAQIIFGMLNNTTLLLFGVLLSAAILSIDFNKRNIIILLAFCVVINGVQVTVYIHNGLDFAIWLYPFITHLPSVLLFTLCFKRKILSAFFAVFSAYLCCQLSKWLSLLVELHTGELWISYAFRSVVTVALGIIIIRYFAASIGVILTKPTKTVLIFGILPCAYYLFDYTATVYTDLLYNGSEAAYEFLPFVLCIAYLFFSIMYFKEYEEKCEAEQQKRLVELKRTQSEKEIEAIKRSEYAISIIRHDMRHFMANIVSFIEQGDTDKAKSYIKEIITATDKTATKKYCENEIVNMIISSYNNEIINNSIKLDHNIDIPEKLPFSDTDITSILSNGLENAIRAVSILDDTLRHISLDLYMKDGKLLLSIKNPCDDNVVMDDGIPLSNKAGHGYGTRSIKYIAEKLGGNCQFMYKDGFFALRVVL